MVDPRETTNKHDRFSGCFAPSHSRTFFSLQKKKCLSLSAVPWCSRPDDPEFDHELESCLIMLSSSDKLTQAFFSLQTKKQNKKKMKIQRPLFVVQAQRFISDPEIKQTLRVQSQGRRLLVGGPSLADRRCSSLKLRIFVFVFFVLFSSLFSFSSPCHKTSTCVSTSSLRRSPSSALPPASRPPPLLSLVCFLSFLNFLFWFLTY